MQNKFHEIDKKIKIYNHLHKLKLNPHDRFITHKDNNLIADYIHNNIHLFCETELRSLTSKCLSLNECKKILSNFELTYYENKTNLLNINDVAKEVSKILKRYHWKAGGHLIEDITWTKKIENNKIYFTNTIDNIDIPSPEITDYLQKLSKQFSNISSNIDISIKIEKASNKIKYIIIKIKDKNTPNNSLISL